MLIFNVPDAPVMNVTEKKVAIDINQTAILTCLSHGVPTPGFRWNKGTQQLYTDRRIKVSVCRSVCAGDSSVIALLIWYNKFPNFIYERSYS